VIVNVLLFAVFTSCRGKYYFISIINVPDQRPWFWDYNTFYIVLWIRFPFINFTDIKMFKTTFILCSHCLYLDHWTHF
jgi:hypothetical protein